MYSVDSSSQRIPAVIVRTSLSVIRSRRGSGGIWKSAKYGMAFTSTPGISPRRIAIPMSAEVTLFETDCIVWSLVPL